MAPGLPLTTEQQAAAIRIIWAARLLVLFPMISVGSRSAQLSPMIVGDQHTAVSVSERDQDSAVVSDDRVIIVMMMTQ